MAPEEVFINAREWQYQEAVKAINEAPVSNLAQALAGQTLGRGVQRRLRAAGVADRVAQARRVNGS